MKNQSFSSETYLLTPSNSSDAVSFNKVYPPKSKAAVTNDSSLSVFVVPGFSTSAPTAVFPASKTVPVDGQYVLPGDSISFDLDDGIKHLAFIHKSSGGTGDVAVTVDTNYGV